MKTKIKLNIKFRLISKTFFSEIEAKISPKEEIKH